jgi:predicted O-methyltransferase YrrM
MSLSALKRKARTARSIFSFVRKAGTAGILSTREIVDIAFQMPPCGYSGPLQEAAELAEFATIVRKIGSAATLEIGTDAGGTFFVLCQVSAPNATVISVDLPGGQISGTPPSVYREYLIRHMKRPKQSFRRIIGDSHSPETLARVQSALGTKRLGVLFIDADHSYEGVKLDFEMYSPLVGSGGVVGFHDIVGDPADSVTKFWDGIKQSYRHQEIIADGNQDWAGIGVLFV